MEGMTAEATKAAFRLQEDVAELHARLASSAERRPLDFEWWIRKLASGDNSASLLKPFALWRSTD